MSPMRELHGWTMRDGQLRRRGYTGVVVGVLSKAERETLRAARQVGIPYLCTEANTGLLPGWTVTDLTPVAPNSQGIITLSGPDPDQPDGVWRNKLFWGELRPRYEGWQIENCWLSARDPGRLMQLDANGNCVAGSIASIRGAIWNDPDAGTQGTLSDSVIDASVWKDPNLPRPAGLAVYSELSWRKRNSVSAGLHGGKATLLRVRIRNIQDAVNMVQTRRTPTDPSFTTLEDCYFSDGTYYWGQDWVAAFPSVPDGPHGDGVQTNTGGNLTILGGRIGGVRDESGFEVENGRNMGADFFNAGMMLQQEVDNTAERRIDNVLMRHVVIEGGTYGINHVYRAARSGAFPQSSTTIEELLFVRRPADLPGGYISVSSEYLHFYSSDKNHRIVELSGDGMTITDETVPVNIGRSY